MSKRQPDDPSRDQVRADQRVTQTLLESIAEDGRLGQTASERERGKDSIRLLATELASGSLVIAGDVASTLDHRIREVDELIGRMLNDILHNPEFQKLESAWRGLARLVNRTSESDRVTIRLMSVARRELARDEVKTRLKVLTSVETLETFGGTPFSILIGDYEFGSKDTGILSTFVRFAEWARAPFIAAAHSSLLGLSSLSHVPEFKQIRANFESDDYAGWDSLRQSLFSKNLVLALPRFLVRKPYKRSPGTSRYSHEENVDGSDSSRLLWGSPIWIIAAQLARAFAQGSWCADVAMSEHTSIDGSLPSFSGWTAEGVPRRYGPLEISASDSLVSLLRDLGVFCLTQDSAGGRVIVSDITTGHLYRARDDPDTSYPVLLRDILPECRIEQYLNFATREARAWIETADELQEHLMRWVAEHSTKDTDASPGHSDRAVFEGGSLRVVHNQHQDSALVSIEGTLIANITATRRSEVAVSTSVLLHSPARPRKGAFDRQQEAPRLRPAAGNASVGSISAPMDVPYGSFKRYLDLLERCALMQRKKLLDDHTFHEIKDLLLYKMAAVIGATVEARSGQEHQAPKTPIDVPARWPAARVTGYWAKYADRRIREQIATSLVSPPGSSISGENLPDDILRKTLEITFDSSDNITAADYSTFFNLLSEVNALLFSVTLQGYATYPSFDKGFDPGSISQALFIDRISKSSPGSVYGSAMAVVAQSFAQIFSIGHQMTEWKLSSVHVQEAKVELAKKEIELEDMKRRTAAKWAAGELDEEIEAARKRAELEELKKKQDEALRERRKLMMEDLSQRYDLLTKALPVLGALPADMQADFKHDIVMRLDSLHDTPLVITGVRLFEGAAKQISPTDSAENSAATTPESK